MRLDKQNLLCDAQAVTTGTQLSTNSIDVKGLATPTANQTTAWSTDTLGNTPIDDVGRSDVEILVQVVTAFTAGTSLQVNLIESANADLSSATIIQSTPAIAEATLKVGYNFRLAVPPGFAARYLGLQFVTVGTHATGNITAGLLPENAKQSNPSVG